MTTVLLGVGEGGFREMHLQLWESRLPKPHHRDADACILVSDLSNLISLLTIRTHHMQFSSYLSSSEHNVSSSKIQNRFPYFIVGNKKDLNQNASSLVNSTTLIEELLKNLFVNFLTDFCSISIPQKNNQSFDSSSSNLKTRQYSSLLSSINSLPLFSNTNNISYLIDLILQYWKPNVRDDFYRLSEQLKGEIFISETSTVIGQESTVIELFQQVVETVANRLIALEK